MFSRWMPPYQRPEGAPLPGVVVAGLALLGGWVLWYLAHHVVGTLVTAACVALVIGLASLLNDRRLARRARERAGEDIGTFARAFDRRAPDFDPWVVRAVWDALAPWTELPGGGRVPLRPTDAIADLGCVDEDLEEVFEEAARRARRLLDGLEENPYYRRVATVGDLVALISRQPRAAAA